jgi:hypothetical protein
MRLRDIVLAEKQEFQWFPWKDGKMPKHVFPMTKNRSFRIRSKWRWRYCKFTCLGNSMRVLVAYRRDQQEYMALLGLDLTEGGTRVIARYEFHGSHPGWHIHSYCDDLQFFLPRHDGRTGHPGLTKIMGGNAKNGNLSINLFDRSATEIAVTKFGLSKVNPSSGLFQ